MLIQNKICKQNLIEHYKQNYIASVIIIIFIKSTTFGMWASQNNTVKVKAADKSEKLRMNLQPLECEERPNQN